MAGEGALQRRGERAADRVQRATERELPVQLGVGEGSPGQVPRGDQDADRDRQVEPAALLRQVGRREIDGNVATRQLETAARERRLHAVLAFLDRGLGQADDREGRQPAAHVHLDAHEGGIHALRGPAEYGRERHGAPPGERRQHGQPATLRVNAAIGRE